jgi:hypothetical protein
MSSFFGKISNLFSKKETLLNEKFLTDNNIKSIKSKDLQIDRSTELAVMPSGKFYKGIYKNNDCAVKIIEIRNEEEIINELFFWNSIYGNEKFILDLYGVYLGQNHVHLVFEFFNYTLDKALLMNVLKEDSRIKITGQILYIFEKIKSSTHQNISGFRPGILCLKQNSVVKLIDFGHLIDNVSSTPTPKNSDLTSEENKIKSLIEKSCLKYLPPEKINFLEENESTDIWSFRVFIN